MFVSISGNRIRINVERKREKKHQKKLTKEPIWKDKQIAKVPHNLYNSHSFIERAKTIEQKKIDSFEKFYIIFHCLHMYALEVFILHIEFQWNKRIATDKKVEIKLEKR